MSSNAGRSIDTKIALAVTGCIIVALVVGLVAYWAFFEERACGVGRSSTAVGWRASCSSSVHLTKSLPRQSTCVRMGRW